MDEQAKDEIKRLSDRVAQLVKELDTARCQTIVAERIAEQTKALMAEYETFFRALKKLQGGV